MIFDVHNIYIIVHYSPKQLIDIVTQTVTCKVLSGIFTNENLKSFIIKTF